MPVLSELVHGQKKQTIMSEGFAVQDVRLEHNDNNKLSLAQTEGRHGKLYDQNKFDK